VPIQTIDRPRERVEEVGLQTAEAKSILRKLQQIVVQDRSPTTWFLWHDNVWRADDTLSSLIDEVDGVREEDRDARRPPLLVLKKLSRALEGFATYIDNNFGAIVNYGERRRCGERIFRRKAMAGFYTNPTGRPMLRGPTKTFARGDNLLGVPALLAWRLARRHRMRKPPPLKR
jgi:hypothetical protein